MFYYLDIASQIRRIATNVSLLERRIERNSNEILSDIVDGELYKRILESRIGREINRKEAFTMTFNTDGISLSDSSSLSIWPCFGSINEIASNERFCVDNIILFGNFLFNYMPD
jgi:hypothetical protein